MLNEVYPEGMMGYKTNHYYEEEEEIQIAHLKFNSDQSSNFHS